MLILFAYIPMFKAKVVQQVVHVATSGDNLSSSAFAVNSSWVHI